jgi:hypothetical protein
VKKTTMITTKIKAMLSKLKHISGRLTKVKTAGLTGTVCIFCIIVLLSLSHRTGISKNELLHQSHRCDCGEEKEEMNLLHAIPLLLLPALETADDN